MTSVKLDTIDFTSQHEGILDEQATQIANICEFGYGFFYLKIDADQEIAVRGILDAARSFFRLPDKEKTKLRNDDSCNYKIRGKPITGTGSGYRGKGCDPNFASDTRESFNIASESYDYVTRTGSGRNKWPNMSSLPFDWKMRIDKYMEIMLDLSIRMRSIIGKSKTMN